jgi:hypothetical protein
MNRLQQIAGVMVLLASPALADTYTFTDFTHNAGAGTLGVTGTVTVTQNGTNDVHIVVSDPGNIFDWVNTGNDSGYQFFFNITGSPTSITIVNNTLGWTNSAGPIAGGIPGDGMSGDFKYGLSCSGPGGGCSGGGQSNQFDGNLVFDVIDTNLADHLTPASFDVPIADSGLTIEFGADLGVHGTSGNTGLVGATLTAVPDGGMTLILLGGALVGIESLRRRVRA